MIQKILPHVVVPLLLILSGLFGLVAINQSWNYELVSYGIFFFTLIYILLFERIIPLRFDWKITKQSLYTDIKHLVFSIAIFDALGKVLAISLTLYIQGKIFTEWQIWDALPAVFVFIIANIIGELLPYLYHRISHQGDPNSRWSLFLWKIHAIHHLPSSLNWYKTNWMHPINMFFNTFLKIAPLLLLGFNADIIFSVGVLHVVIAYISHANIKTKPSFLDYLVVTPQLHHFHHSTNLHEAKNFGNIIPFWDILLGTYYNRAGHVAEVGVVESDNIHYPKSTSYLKQIIFPFKSQ